MDQLPPRWREVHKRSTRYMITRNYIPAFEYHAQTDRNIMYSSIADHNMWFDSWPGVMEARAAGRAAR